MGAIYMKTKKNFACVININLNYKKNSKKAQFFLKRFFTFSNIHKRARYAFKLFFFRYFKNQDGRG